VIGWLVIRAAFSAFWTRLQPLVALAVRYPLQCALIASLCLSAWLWRGWHGEHAGRAADMARVAAAQVDADRIAQQALAETERRYRMKADEADAHYRADFADARDATAIYIRTHRVRAVNQGATGQAVASAESGSAGLPETVPTGVVVDQSDVQACANLYAYALAAHDWAVSISQ